MPDDDKTDDERFYLLDNRTVVGNCALWWCPEGKGYTCNLDEAGTFSRKEAFSQRDTDIPVPLSIASGLAIRHVPLDTLRQHVKIGKTSNLHFPPGVR